MHEQEGHPPITTPALVSPNEQLTHVKMINDYKEVTSDALIADIIDEMNKRDDVPFITLRDTPLVDVSITELDASTEYSHKFGDREVKYYGSRPYNYGGVFHYACDMNENPALSGIFERVKAIFPDIPLNSALITKYVDNESQLPLHADDEEEIDNHYPIISLSVGESRPMLFQDTRTSNKLRVVTLQQGDIMIMTGRSQRLYKHAIPACTEETGSRLSVTFRCIRVPTRPPRRSRQYSDVAATSPTRERSDSFSSNRSMRSKCLILHDSLYNQFRGQSVDGHATTMKSVKTLQSLSQPRTLNYLKKDSDLQHLEDSDSVGGHLGVNDLKHNPTHLVVKDLKAALLNMAQCCEARILFSLILPVGDSELNKKVKDFNEQATKLVSDLRKKSYFKSRLFTVFNPEFTSKFRSELNNLYEDSIHINSQGLSILAKHLSSVLRMVSIRYPVSDSTTTTLRRHY